jgi:excisionase family DNA binding protein
MGVSAFLLIFQEEVSMNQNLIGIKEMASKLDVPVSWIYSRTRTNDIPCYRVGKYVRFDESEIWEWHAEKEFICSKCVQLFLSADQAELMRAYNKAIEKGYPDKARAIKSFLIPGEKINGQQKPISQKHRRHFNRKGIVRTIGDKKKAHWTI